MQKIPTYLERDWEGDRSRVLDQVADGCEWVAQGEGVATVKYDGTAIRIRDGHAFKRHEVKRGKAPPLGFEPAAPVDPETGKQPGWVAVGDGPEDQWIREALDRRSAYPYPDGTYELIGPKIQGNPHRRAEHLLVPHGGHVIEPQPGRTYGELESLLRETSVEGIVWHHPDGRMAKIKARDFGIRWPRQ